jgi:hypothetical protein
VPDEVAPTAREVDLDAAAQHPVGRIDMHDRAATRLFDVTDAARPALLASRKQHLGGPRSVVFAPCGRRYAVGGQDNVVTVVDLARMDAKRRDPAARARERAGGGLDRAQWETFAPGTEYLGVR